MNEWWTRSYYFKISMLNPVLAMTNLKQKYLWIVWLQGRRMTEWNDGNQDDEHYKNYRIIVNIVTVFLVRLYFH